MKKMLCDRPLAEKPTATVEQAILWAKANGAAQIMLDLAPLYWQYAEAVGINPVFSYCQTAYEEAFLTYNGCLLDSSYRNTAGIKKSDDEVKKIMSQKYPNAASSDHIAECHMRFVSWEDSVKAQIDHAALYAGLDGYPKKYPSETTDPRHFTWCFGIGKTVLEWAPHYATNAYGEALLKMMDTLENTKTSANVLYRVRKSFEDEASSLGSYSILENAISACDAGGEGYFVYKMDGSVIYSAGKRDTAITVKLQTLKEGMRQDCFCTNQIKVLQILLMGYGYSCGPCGVDGSFGQDTAAAVKAFQKEKGLNADGVVGSRTWAALLHGSTV